MHRKRPFCLLAMIMLTAFLTACGGSGGSGDAGEDASVTTNIKSGIAVDPYIANAQFEEISTGGKLLQVSAGNSNTFGQFQFKSAIRDGSIVQIRMSAKGLHVNQPYTGVIKRQVFIGDEEPIVVSPLTTLLANGMSPAAVLQMMESAGLSGLTESLLYADPMAKLTDKTGDLTTADLVLLQANMAVNAFMAAIEDFDYGGASSAAASLVSFADIAIMVKNILNPTLYQQMVSAYGTSFTAGDMANTAVDVNRSMMQEMVGSGSPALSAVTIEEIMAVAGEFYLARTGDGVVAPGTGTGGGTTPPANSVDGQAIFSANCTGCHTVGTTGTSYSELAGDGSKVTTKFDGGKSHNGNTLSADEIIAVATYFDSQGGATDPGTGTGGTTPPIGDRSGQQVFDQECANCHAMGTHDTTSIYGDLAGLGTTIIPKIEGGHQSKYQVVTAGELTALADFADTFAPVSGGGSPPACGSCHSLPPTGSAAGAHAVHWALNGVGTSCSNCHPTDAVHPSGGLVDLGFASVWDAKSGPATDNLDGTCSNIICHGGKKTPVWGSGTIDVDTQCTSCHASGTSQYNSYSSTSGKHGKHLSAGIECSECHEPAKLQIGHFTNLSTPGFEQSAASTLQNSLNYTGTSCNPSCHSSERW